jgi:small-conductance mechanosensitive channel
VSAAIRIALAAAALWAAGAAGAIPLPGVPAPDAASAGAGATAKKDAPPPAVAAPQAIPVAHVFRAADELDAPLRRAAAAAEADPAVLELERRLAATEATAARLRSDLELRHLQDASAREIERVRQAVAREDLLLSEGEALLEDRSEALAAFTRDLDERLAAWQATAEAARREAAPAPVLRRIAQVEETLRAEAARARGRQDRVLELQARVSELRAELTRVAAAVEEADAALKRQLFELESAPLWRAVFSPGAAGIGLAGQLRQALRESGRDVGAFVSDEAPRIAIHLALVLALGFALLALRRPLAAMKSDDPALRGAERIFSRPWSGAVLLSLTVTGWLYPPLPPAARDVFALAFLVPLLRLLPGLVPDVFRRPLYALAALAALDRLAALAPPRTVLARLAVLAVTLVALGGLANGLRRRGWARFERGGAWSAAARIAALGAAGLLAISALSNLVGNASLAERLTHATLLSAALAAILVGVQVVLVGALAALLHVPFLRRRPLVARHRAILERRFGAAVRLGAVALWAWKTATELGIAGGAAAALGAVLGLRLRVGGLDVSLGDVTAFAVTLGLAFGAARLVRFLLDEGVFAELALPRGVPTAVSTTVQYALVLLGFFWAVLASGMEMSRFSFLVGALGVGIGFGLQNVVNNLVSGLILLYERPVQVGDVVEVGAVVGEVTRIGVRSSTVRTFAGAEVIVPNATLIAADVTNWTLSDRRRRVELPVGVAYGTAPERVIALLLAAVRGRAGVLEDPEPVALFLRFGESSLEFALRFWTSDFDRWQALASEVLVEIDASLRGAGIEIPFPQRDLHVRSLAPAAAEALAAASRERLDPLALRNVAVPPVPPRAKPDPGAR